MKKILSFLLMFILIFSSVKVKAFVPLDRIDLYEITINPREDGTLDMEFNIEWTVLNSVLEGPLEWVKIGVANSYIDELKSISNNIKRINVVYDIIEGSYIRIDLDRRYYEGETINLRFSFHQSRMFFLEDTICKYHYKPGYFNEIKVTKAVVKWNIANTISSNAINKTEQFLIWESPLHYGETIEVIVRYNQSSFKVLNQEMQFVDDGLSANQVFKIILIIVGIVIVAIILINVFRRITDPYYYERGFFGTRYYRRHFFGHRFHGLGHRPRRHFGGGYNRHGGKVINPTISFGGGSRPGGGFSCACACACAGGGRAGCSTKDFYKTNLQTNVINKVLSK